MSKDFYNKAYQIDNPTQYAGADYGVNDRATLLYEKTKSWLNSTGLDSRHESRILEIGCGMAYLSDVHPGWYGIEYSNTAVKRIKEIKGTQTRIFEADAQNVPFENKFFEGVFSWAAMEHIPNPDKVLQEIDRVLTIGGYALIAPAWHCRSWTVKKLKNRPYNELSFKEKVEKAFIPFLELLLIRFLATLHYRILDEIKLFFGKQMPLRYKTLKPRWDLIEKYGHISDDDAVADIDSHSCICFFKSRRYEVISHKTFVSRFFARHEPVIVRKKTDQY